VPYFYRRFLTEPVGTEILYLLVLLIYGDDLSPRTSFAGSGTRWGTHPAGVEGKSELRKLKHEGAHEHNKNCDKQPWIGPTVSMVG
jgi:hypothetical protein